MKPNLLLFTALLLISAVLFCNLPEKPRQSHYADGVRPSPAEPNVSADLKQMRKDYALLRQEMALLRAKVDQTQAPPAESPAAALAAPDAGEDAPPGVTIYLDTSKLPSATEHGREWTAVTVHDAGQASDGSKQAVVSLTKFMTPQAGDDEPAEATQAMPVSSWH